MPGPSTLAFGGVSVNAILYASLTPPATVVTNSSTTSTYTINGLLVGDCIDMYPQVSLAPSTTYLTIGGAFVSAANILSIQWVNSTSASSSGAPTAIDFIIQVSRPDLLPYGFRNFPKALV